MRKFDFKYLDLFRKEKNINSNRKTNKHEYNNLVVVRFQGGKWLIASCGNSLISNTTLG